MSQGHDTDDRSVAGVVASVHHGGDAQTNPPVTVGQALRLSRDKRVGVDRGRRIDEVSHDGEVDFVLKRHREHVEGEVLRVSDDRREVSPRLAEGFDICQGPDQWPESKHMLAGLVLAEFSETRLGAGDLDLSDDGDGQ